MQVALAAGEARHGPLVSDGRHGAGLGRWWDQRRVVVRCGTRMRHARTASTGKSLPKRPALRVAAGPRLARVPAVTHVHSAQGLGQDTHLDRPHGKSRVIITLGISSSEIPSDKRSNNRVTRSRVTFQSRTVDSPTILKIVGVNIFIRDSRVNLRCTSRSNWNKFALID